MTRTFVSVVGARPNFMKLAPVARLLERRRGLDHVVIHTGQHYDPEMSETFLQDLGIRPPEVNLQVGSGSHAAQTAAALVGLEVEFQRLQPDVVIVYGDVNSTLAAALVASKLSIPVAHVEAGLRSGDLSMPEEINRLVTDRLSRYLFAPSRDACDNLGREGASPDHVNFVGNVMIDSLIACLPAARERNTAARLGVAPGSYIVVTLHRPGNVDSPETLAQLCEGLRLLAVERPVLFPVHPRTRRALAADGRLQSLQAVRLLEPLPYVDMLSLVAAAAMVVTDSGGLQEETTFLGVPCLTVRPNTERPITIECGTNRLVPARAEALVEAAARTRLRPAMPIERWDGRAAERVVAVLCDSAHFN